MIKVEGYKAFYGTMKITPDNPDIVTRELHGEWLYKPETGCWYGGGSSYPEEICTIKDDGSVVYQIKQSAPKTKVIQA